MTKTVACVAALLVCVGVASGGTLDEAEANSVAVVSGEMSGSGVVFKNGRSNFVWTAAHVVANGQHVRVLLNPATGRPRFEVSYDDVQVFRAVYRDGRKVGEESRLAEVVRFSDIGHGGEDLCLVRLYDPDFGGPGVTFSQGKDVPSAGEALWHVGSMEGRRGMNSVSDGVFSTPGRLLSYGRFFETRRPRVFDQATFASLQGSSGGGVFRKSTGECVGLVSCGLDNTTESANYIVPARRIREYAKRSGCEWAVDPSVPVPAEDHGPVTDRSFPMPEGAWAALNPEPPGAASRMPRADE